MRITTTYKTDPNTGAGKILATGNGKQRTVPYDHALGRRANHGAAAGTLALVLITGKKAREVAADTAKVIRVSDPNKMRFSLGE